MPEKYLKWENAEEWGEIECPMLGGAKIMTYIPKGYPAFDSYTAPFVDDGEIYYYKYDHDYGGWDDTLFALGEYVDGVTCGFRDENRQ